MTTINKEKNYNEAYILNGYAKTKWEVARFDEEYKLKVWRREIGKASNSYNDIQKLNSYKAAIDAYKAKMQYIIEAINSLTTYKLMERTKKEFLSSKKSK